MTKKQQLILLILASTVIVLLMVFSFKNIAVFWYIYTFTLLLGMALALACGEVMDRLSTTRYFLIGLPLGIIGYIITAFIYNLLPFISQPAFNNVTQLLEIYSPTTIWQYALLIVIIVAGEEMLWRAYIQQALKNFIATKWAILLSASHFAFALLLCGFYIGALAAFISSIVFGIIYEWLKSLPLLIVAHLVMILLLFLLLPLT